MNTETTQTELKEAFETAPVPTVPEDIDTKVIDESNSEQQEPVDEQMNDLQKFMQLRNEAVASREAVVASLSGKKKFSRADIMKAFAAFSQENTIMEQLCSMLLNDSFQLSFANAQMQQQMFQLGQTNALLKLTLIDKGILTQEDIDKAWEEKLKPQLEARIKQAEREANPSGLVTPGGAPVETVQ